MLCLLIKLDAFLLLRLIDISDYYFHAPVTLPSFVCFVVTDRVIFAEAAGYYA
jgi:hypothetical protein